MLRERNSPGATDAIAGYFESAAVRAGRESALAARAILDSGWSAHIDARLPDGVSVHPGTLKVIRSLLIGRSPVSYCAGETLHLTFALKAGSFTDDAEAKSLVSELLERPLAGAHVEVEILHDRDLRPTPESG